MGVSIAMRLQDGDGIRILRILFVFIRIWLLFSNGT